MTYFEFHPKICSKMIFPFDIIQIGKSCMKRRRQQKSSDTQSKSMSKSEHDAMDEICSWNDLSKEDLEMYRANPTIADTILRLYKQGFKCSEDDPLLILAVDPAHLQDSIDYLNGGNYGLGGNAPGWPGGQPPVLGNPLPVGVDAAPPCALGRYIMDSFGADGVRDLSQGALSVFHVPNLHIFMKIDGAVKSSRQFHRIGNTIGQMLNVPAQPVLVKCILLTRLDGPSQLVPDFTSTG
jgi:hypothetical protein